MSKLITHKMMNRTITTANNADDKMHITITVITYNARRIIHQKLNISNIDYLIIV
jgi:hypothetical protein